MKNKGFTFFEIITVMAIIGIFAAIFIPVLSSVRGGDANYKVTHRHNDGTTTVYITHYRPYKYGSDAGVTVRTLEGKTVVLTGDIVIEEPN